ncbi:MAG: flagellar motor protein MotB, partial [Verrucomicrobiota bacterium]
DHVTKAQRASGATLAWMLAVVVVLLIALSAWLWSSSKTNLRALESARVKLDEAARNVANAHERDLENQHQVENLEEQLANLEQERENVTQRAKGLEDEMRADLESKDVTISKLQGKLTVNILDRIMFDSGEAVLKPGGEEVMKKIASLLKDHPELKIHVIGHTDNIQIRSQAHSRFASNWELSTARALAALHFLTEKSGLDPRRVGAVGYGEFRPIADNATSDGRAKNRRIAILILPDELIEADTAAPLKSTNHFSPVSEP